MQIDQHIYIMLMANKSSGQNIVFRINMPFKHVLVLYCTVRFANKG